MFLDFADRPLLGLLDQYGIHARKYFTQFLQKISIKSYLNNKNINNR